VSDLVNATLAAATNREKTVIYSFKFDVTL